MDATRNDWMAPGVGSSFELAAESSPAEEVTRLFRELHAPVVRYLVSMGLPAADGEEVAQEVFVALFHHLRRGRPRTNLRAWVFRVAHNQGLKRRYGQRRWLDFAAEADGAEQAPCGEPNPEERFAARQGEKLMRAVVRALPERDQACLHLRTEGLTYREIARALGMSLGAVSASIQRSILRIRRVQEGR